MNEHKKTFWIVSSIILMIFFIFFFIKAIPVPVENIDGAINPDRFIFGGWYFTSGLYELWVGNYLGFLSFLMIFIIPLGTNYYFYRSKKWD